MSRARIRPDDRRRNSIGDMERGSKPVSALPPVSTEGGTAAPAAAVTVAAPVVAPAGAGVGAGAPRASAG